MVLTDYHMHSRASYDAEDTMLAMALAAGEMGVQQLCFTDHCDLDDYLTGNFDPNHIAYWPKALELYAEIRRDAPAALNVAFGMELGEGNHYPELAAELAARPELDFVLASVHNLRGMKDFYALKYESREHCLALLDLYLDELLETAKLDYFDVLSHIGYCRRYMLRAGYDEHITVECYGDRLETLLKTLIEKGKGIELNCSGMRHPGIGEPIPGLDVIRLYHELGGEIITVGSDAHRVNEAGHWIQEGHELLGRAGFRYVTVFKNRKPEFIRI